MSRCGIALAAVVVVFGAGVVQAQQQARPAARPKASAPTTGVKGIATSLEIMRTMTIPFSDAIFTAGSEPPKDDKGWAALRDQAVALAESGNLLMVGGRSRGGQWMTFARAQVDAADVAVKAATAKSVDQLSKAADAIYGTCSDCHKVYMPNSRQ